MSHDPPYLKNRRLPWKSKQQRIRKLEMVDAICVPERKIRGPETTALDLYGSQKEVTKICVKCAENQNE